MPLTSKDLLHIHTLPGRYRPVYATTPPQYLDCPICLETLREPVVCMSGQHPFCGICCVTWLEESEHCPIDCEALSLETLKRAPQVVRDMLDALQVQCMLRCGWVGTLEARYVHLLNDCPEGIKEDGHRRGGGTGRPVLGRPDVDLDRDAASRYNATTSAITTSTSSLHNGAAPCSSTTPQDLAVAGQEQVNESIPADFAYRPRHYGWPYWTRSDERQALPFLDARSERRHFM